MNKKIIIEVKPRIPMLPKEIAQGKRKAEEDKRKAEQARRLALEKIRKAEEERLFQARQFDG